MKIIGKIRPSAVAAILLVSCLSGTARPENVPKLESFPETSRIWMGIEEGVIRPAAHQQIRASSGGYIKIHAANHTQLEKGDHWATLDPVQIELETRSLELDRIRHERKLAEARRSKTESNNRLRLELHETERNRAEFVAASQSNEIPAALRQRALEAIEEADLKIEELNQMLKPEEFERSMQLEQDDGELQLERKERQLRSLRLTSELTAAFGGELRITESALRKIEEADDPSQPVWFDGNELIATIVDDDQYEITITATSPLLAQIPQDDLLVLFEESRTGKLIAGDFVRMVEVDSGNEIARNYIFTIDPNSLADARNSVGQRNLIHIYRRFSEPCRLVYKKDIAFVAPEVLESAGWSGLVRHLWPNSEILQVGPQTIAVKPSGAN